MQTVQEQAERLTALEKSHAVENLETTQPEMDNLVINESKKLINDNQANIDNQGDLVNRDNLVSNNGLSQNQLADRLKCSVRRLMARRADPLKLAEYTRSKDPDGIPWEYRDKKYYPAKSTWVC